SLNNLGMVAELQGEIEAARSYYEQGRQLCERIEDGATLLHMLGNLGRMAFKRGDIPTARSLLAQALALCRTLRELRLAACNLEVAAGADLQEGNCARAARLLGMATSLREQIGAPPDSVDRVMIDRYLKTLRETLAEDQLAAAMAAGRAMDWEQ